MALKVNERDFEYQCRGIDQGFNVILTPPGEALKMSRNTFRLPLMEDAIIMIRPRIVVNTRGLRRLKPHQRQCYYVHERTLRFYRNYTQTNCYEECLSNFTRIECGCVKFSLPSMNCTWIWFFKIVFDIQFHSVKRKYFIEDFFFRFAGDSSTKVCGPGSIECYKMAETRLSTSYRARAFREKCSCLQTCTTLEYSADIDRIESDLLVMKQTDGIDFDKEKG